MDTLSRYCRFAADSRSNKIQIFVMVYVVEDDGGWWWKVKVVDSGQWTLTFVEAPFIFCVESLVAGT
jgi:hypothetical protein